MRHAVLARGCALLAIIAGSVCKAISSVTGSGSHSGWPEHCPTNFGKLPMFLIGAQSGTYLNDDTIGRYDDVYHLDSSA
jgi:hypothetical protein